MDVSNIAQAKRVAEQATVQEHLPWYIIDPTGVLIRKQREQYFSKRTVTRMYTRPREASRVSTGVEVSRLGELRHWTLARITLFPAWDHVAAIALIFTAAVTPFEVGFLPPSRSALEPLFLINRMVDCVFVADVVFQFFIMVPTDDGGDGLTQYEMRLPKIALRYVRGWFALDIVSIAPSIFDSAPAAEAANPVELACPLVPHPPDTSHPILATRYPPTRYPLATHPLPTPTNESVIKVSRLLAWLGRALGRQSCR